MPPAGLENLNILVVDDTETNLLIIQAYLSEWSITNTGVKNGKLAVEKARENQFDIILMDLNMPVLNGYEATKQIRELPLPKQPLILAISSADSEEDIKRCLEYGMDGHMAKPITKNKLRAALEERAA